MVSPIINFQIKSNDKKTLQKANKKYIVIIMAKTMIMPITITIMIKVTSSNSDVHISKNE